MNALAEPEMTIVRDGKRLTVVPVVCQARVHHHRHQKREVERNPGPILRGARRLLNARKEETSGNHHNRETRAPGSH